MIGFGWTAQVQGDPNAIWPLFGLGLMAQIGVFAIVHSRVQHGADADPSARIYRFSFYWMFLTWNLITLIMVLDKANSISYDSKAIGYVVTEFASTVIFGLVIVGSRESSEGLVTLGSRFAQAVVGDDSHLVSKSLAGGLSFGGSSLVTRTASGV
jgi:bacteriorhodopsin